MWWRSTTESSRETLEEVTSYLPLFFINVINSLIDAKWVSETMLCISCLILATSSILISIYHASIKSRTKGCEYIMTDSSCKEKKSPPCLVYTLIGLIWQCCEVLYQKIVVCLSIWHWCCCYIIPTWHSSKRVSLSHSLWFLTLIHLQPCLGNILLFNKQTKSLEGRQRFFCYYFQSLCFQFSFKFLVSVRN